MRLAQIPNQVCALARGFVADLVRVRDFEALIVRRFSRMQSAKAW